MTNLRYPYSLVPNKVTQWEPEEYVLDIAVSEGGIETRTLYQSEPGINARMTLEYSAGDCELVYDLVSFWRTTQGKYRAFVIPSDHGVWMQIMNPSFFRDSLIEETNQDGTVNNNTDPVWRFDSKPVFTPLTDSLASWQVTLKHLVYENL